MTSVLTKDDLIDGHVLCFDPGDPLNGSLYLCTPRSGPAPFERDAVLDRMRAAGLWSGVPAKEVPDEQRDAYKAGLVLVEATAYASPAGRFAIARFDHPKYPSDAGRWQAWQAFFDEACARERG